MSLKAVAGVAVVAMAGAAFWWSSGADERLRACEGRVAGLAGQAVLHEQPDGVIRSDPLAAGCDVDRAEAYASHTSYAAIDRAVVEQHIRDVAGRDGWTITGSGAFEAEKEVDGRRLNLRLDFPAPNTYLVSVGE